MCIKYTFLKEGPFWKVAINLKLNSHDKFKTQIFKINIRQFDLEKIIFLAMMKSFYSIDYVTIAKQAGSKEYLYLNLNICFVDLHTTFYAISYFLFFKK